VFEAGGGHSVRFLLVHHASGGHWDHPKGHAEENESPEETVRREVAEEGGVRIRLVPGFEAEAHWILPDGRPKTVTYFLAEKIGECEAGGPEGEILGTAWLTCAEARARMTYDTGRQVLDEAAERLGLCGEA
jgi:8-oxo-dGTP pyrophosphatase MutT (NUDIX family)